MLASQVQEVKLDDRDSGNNQFYPGNYQTQYVKIVLNPFMVSTQTSSELHQTAATTTD